MPELLGCSLLWECSILPSGLLRNAQWKTFLLFPFKVLHLSLSHSTTSKWMVVGDIHVPLQNRIIWIPQDYKICQTQICNSWSTLLFSQKWSTLLSSELLKKSIRQSCILKTQKTEQSFSVCESHFPHRLNSELQPAAKIRDREHFIHIWSSNGQSFLPKSTLGVMNPACVPWEP